jgi:hypothetical protein
VGLGAEVDAPDVEPVVLEATLALSPQALSVASSASAANPGIKRLEG